MRALKLGLKTILFTRALRCSNGSAGVVWTVNWLSKRGFYDIHKVCFNS